MTRLYTACLLLVFLTGLSSCRKGWLDVNYNPYDLTENSATPDLILPALIMDMPYTSPHESVLNTWMGYWAGALPVYSGSTLHTYNLVADPSMPIFTVNSGVIRLAELMEYKAAERGEKFYQAIGMVARALTWTRKVDFQNNLPYREAFKPDILRPKYDKGEMIYEDAIKLLDTASSLIHGTEAALNLRLTETDIIFHGNKALWLKLINTIKLRLMVHQANRADRAEYIAEVIRGIGSEGSGFLQAGESANINPGFTELKQNRYYSYFSRHSLQAPYEFMIDGTLRGYFERSGANFFAMELLKQDNDPRLGLFYCPAAKPLPPGVVEPFPQSGPAEFRANKFGLLLNSMEFPYQGYEYVSLLGGVQAETRVTPSAKGILKGYDMPHWLLTSVESLFLQAEAIFRGWIPGDPEQAYIAAVRESFRWLNAGGNSMDAAASDAVFEQWYNAEKAAGNPRVSWSAAPDKYKLLMFQKYMAFNGIEPVEAYIDYRRNGMYPDVPASLDPAKVHPHMPLRTPYDPREYLVNEENVKAEGPIDIFSDKIWWMP